jgi:putative FmdB family regulatory protein
MPIYEYECLTCHEEFEELVFGSSPAIECPACNGREVKRLLSVTAIKTDSGFVSTASGGSCGGCTSGSCGGCSCKH